MSLIHRFVQNKFAYGGPVLGLSQFLLLPQLPQKLTLSSKVVEIIISSWKSKSVIHSVGQHIAVKKTLKSNRFLQYSMTKVII